MLHDIANLSFLAFKLQIPLDNSTGSIGITLSNMYTLVPLFLASLSNFDFSLT